MASLPNCMLFLPTATDAIVQAAYSATGTNPQFFVTQMTRTGATVNTVAGFAYQSDMRDVNALSGLVANLFTNR